MQIEDFWKDFACIVRGIYCVVPTSNSSVVSLRALCCLVKDQTKFRFNLLLNSL